MLLCKDDYEKALFEALSLMISLGHLESVRWQDVKVEEGKVQILIWLSKADQLGKDTQITVGQCSISSICLVRATHVYLKVRGQHSGYFFQHTDSRL